MARKLRVEFEGAIYHVMNRGDRREDIFVGEADRHLFLELLGQACAKTGWKIHAYVLMSNHYHLMLETPQANLVAGMKWLQNTYTIRFNRRHRLSDAAGNNIGYSPWGNRFLFTGREWLSDLKLYDYRNRMYQPELGRFMQPDPKEFAAGDYNLYRYCHNDPVNRSDPTGLEDLNYFDNGVFGLGREALRKWVTRSPDDDHTFTVGAHGDKDAIWLPASQKFLTAAAFAARIQNDQRLLAADKVVLYSCSTGEGKNPFAQQLANILNKIVIAPTSTLWVRSDGSYFVAPIINPDAPAREWKPDLTREGTMKIFRPEKPH
jgi:RHS repeat-associated protein